MAVLLGGSLRPLPAYGSSMRHSLALVRIAASGGKDIADIDLGASRHRC